MERNSGSRHSRPEISEQAGYAEVGKVMATARSRSPSRERHGDSRRQYRKRSPSRAEKRTHDEDRNDREDGHSHRSRPSRHHDSHRRPRRDGDRDSERQRHSHHRSRHCHGSKKRSPSPVRTNDHSDDRRDVASQSGSRYGNTHECIDSTLKTQHIGAVTLPPTPTPPTTHTARVPPPEAERHYTSHRCHHHSHNDHDRDTVSRSTTARSQHHQPRPPSPPPAPVKLPYGARALSRWDFAVFEPLFAHYLELQNNVRLADLDEDAVRDRWKVFVNRWNGGELDSRWYEPEMFLRVVRLRATEEARVRAAAAGNGRGDPGIMTPPMTGASFASEMVGSVVTDMTGITKGEETAMDDNAEEGDDEDDYAPPLPPPLQLAEPPGRMTAPTTKPGPAIPNLQDLELRRSLQVEAEEDRLASLRLARRADRDQQKERIEELAPRAEPGSRERKLEKRQVTTDVMRQFASAREAGDMEEVGDKELIGGGDGADDYRRMLANLQKKKTEREVRREEIVRAKNAERDERLREYRTREEGTVEMLREMARQKFG